MGTIADSLPAVEAHPVGIHVEPVSGPRNRLTVAFRAILAIPHLILVGGPIAMAFGWSWQSERGGTHEWGASGGLLGAVAAAAAMFAWFAIVFTGRHPIGLWSLAAFYLRWRVRVTAYVALLRDEYPPFGDGPYPAQLMLEPPAGLRDRLSVAFRLVLVLPHFIALCFLSVAWFVSTVIAWFAILVTGHYPHGLESFALGVMRWNVRVEAYVLLLHDEYPPFRLAE
jgi:Domain of unknown function (DUF4389)